VFINKVIGAVAASLALSLLAACAIAPPPVPLSADPGSPAALAGRWDGEYWSREAERSGSIRFELNATGDSAVGEVVMVPSGYDRPVGPVRAGDRVTGGVPEPLRALRIAFVRVSGDQVSGVLEPYQDPECGCVLRTTFSGRLTGDVISGTYESCHYDCGKVVTGEWRVQRTRRP